MRIAWFVPMPERRDATATAPLTHMWPLAAGQHEIEVFTGAEREAAPWRGGPVPVRNAVEFAWRHRQRPFDLNVYQLGRTAKHDFVWGYLWNYPGLVVLEDRFLHEARARILLERLEPRLDHYGAELSYNHGIDPDIRRALATFTGATLRAWPMRRAIVAGARSAAVHSESLADELRAECPEAGVDLIPPGAADPGNHAELRRTKDAESVRRSLGLTPDGLLISVLGPLARSRRIPQVLQAVRWLRASRADTCLLIAGVSPDDYDPAADIAREGPGAGAVLEHAVTDADLDACLGASDVALCLSWPPSAEVNALWMRCLASGVTTIVTDQTDYDAFPLLDPRIWPVTAREGEDAASAVEPVAFLTDPLNEPQTLRLALRTAADPDLRARLGRAARALWAVRHTPAHMWEGYLRAIDRAASQRPPGLPFPDHHRPDVYDHTRRLLGSVGAVLPPELSAHPPRADGSR